MFRAVERERLARVTSLETGNFEARVGSLRAETHALREARPIDISGPYSAWIYTEPCLYVLAIINNATIRALMDSRSKINVAGLAYV